MSRTFGEVPGYSVGSTFPDRTSLRVSGVHTPNQAGISGGARDGAESIVISGGYADDLDMGTTIIYTGAGGRDPNSGRQIANQELTRGNAALALSKIEGFPIRVIRGSGGNPTYSPTHGLRYDGLFRISDFWHEIGVDGYRVYRFRLDLINDLRQPGDNQHPEIQLARREESFVQRIITSNATATTVKMLHNYHCQVCGVRITTALGAYAEAAHIQPLGPPHNGPEAVGNLLCLCPNDHVRFTNGAIYVDDRGQVIDALSSLQLGPLRLSIGHHVDKTRLEYHRSHHVP